MILGREKPGTESVTGVMAGVPTHKLSSVKGDRAMNRQQSHESEATGPGWVVGSPDLQIVSLQFLASIHAEVQQGLSWRGVGRHLRSPESQPGGREQTLINKKGQKK